MKIKNQKSGNSSTNIQADKIVVNESVALYSIEEVLKKLLGTVFGELPEITKKAIQLNQSSYFEVLSENLSKIKFQAEELDKVVNSPDFQFISKTAAITASRSSSEELHKNLSSLIVHRINKDKDDLTKIAYDEAISTIGKLTTDQLKIITLCYLLRYTSFSGVVSWESYNTYLNMHIKPFLDFKNSNAAFQHIDYTGCGSGSVLTWAIPRLHKQEYSFLFLNPVSEQEIGELNISPELRKELLVPDTTKGQSNFNVKNKDSLTKYLTEKIINEDLKTRLTALFDRHIKNDEEVKNMIIEKTDIGKQLINIWETTEINNLSLTSVGIVIGASYFEQITGNNIDINIWIN